MNVEKLLGMGVVALGILSGCGGTTSAPDGGPGNDAAAVIDMGGPAPDTGTTVDTGSPGVDAASTDAPMSDAGPQAMVTASVTLPYTPSAIVYDATTPKLYVAMTDVSSNGRGIAVLDPTTLAVTTTFANPNPMSATNAPRISSLALDEAAHVLYAGSDQYVFVIDATAGTLTRSISVPDGATSIRLETTTHRLYGVGSRSVAPPMRSQAVLVIIDTTTGMIAHTVPLTDLSYPVLDNALAFDGATNSVYVCGGDSVNTFAMTAVDTLDGATGAATAAQRAFAGSVVGCSGDGPAATVATRAPGADLLDPGHFDPGPDFHETGVVSDHGVTLVTGYSMSTGAVQYYATTGACAGVVKTIEALNPDAIGGIERGVVGAAGLGHGDSTATIPFFYHAFAPVMTDSGVVMQTGVTRADVPACP